MLPIMQAADAAELRGDALEAVRVIAAHPNGPDGKLFWRWERLERLSQLVGLHGLLPRWATSRWILAQAAQHLDQANRRRNSQAMHVALQVQGRANEGGSRHHRQELQVRIRDRDWVFRQVLLYELGGLGNFLCEVAPPDLVAGADRIWEWVGAPLEAFRFRRESVGSLTWERLGSGETVETLDLGSAALLAPGDCAIGRVVPIDEGAMFESAPLRVPETAARRVADDPESWVAAVAAACRETDDDGNPACFTGGHDFALLTDVPRLVRHLVQSDFVASRGGRAAADPDELVHQGVQFLRAALDGELGDEDGVSPWPTVAATLLDNSARAGLMATLIPEDRPRLVALGARLAVPAATVCQMLADGLVEAA